VTRVALARTSRLPVRVATVLLVLWSGLGIAAPLIASELPRPAPHLVTLSTYEAVLAESVNTARLEHGLAPLRPLPELTDDARRWAWVLAGGEDGTPGPLEHGGLRLHPSATWSAQNIGEGRRCDPAELFRAFTASPLHREAFLDPRARYQGVGVRFVRAGRFACGTAWVAWHAADDYTTGYGPARTVPDR